MNKSDASCIMLFSRKFNFFKYGKLMNIDSFLFVTQFYVNKVLKQFFERSKTIIFDGKAVIYPKIYSNNNDIISVI